jgi:hypothetical protein
LALDERTSWEHWTAIGAKIAAQADASSWWLGDWLVFGERQFEARYTRAISSTGLEYKTLRNYAVVARRFPVSRRRDTLSFSHHAELSSLDDVEQERWLDLALKHQWSKAELRHHIRAARGSASRTETLAPVRLMIDRERTDRWRQAAVQVDREFEEWIIQTLDEAARSAAAPERSRSPTPTTDEPGINVINKEEPLQLDHEPPPRPASL